MSTDTTKEEAIFDAAIQLDDAVARKAYLDETCGGDSTLRSAVEELLRFHDTQDDVLTTPAVSLFPPANVEAAEQPGTVIGRYRIVERIGEGGFGAVYRAEQIEPVRRDVALKIIKPGMDSREIIRRFEAERQALALMNHVNVATVLDAGSTTAGRPYFVMELVAGLPIDEFCESRRLSVPDRLRLFVQVCRGVQHAHQKGLVHRDLKPSNLLVVSGEGDSAPMAKVIDFGIAKALHQPANLSATREFRAMLGTPEYMSPEQVTLDGDIDTRADIYALGGVLYKLLTGATPLQTDAASRPSFEEMLRAIRDQEPVKPSQRVRCAVGWALLPVPIEERTWSGMPAANKGRTGVPILRKGAAQSLSRILCGDLDWIVMKALEKDRARRYETVSELAADIERYLNHEPIAAGPPSAWYRASKFVRRHRATVTTAAIASAVLVIAGLTMFGVSYARISAALTTRDRALVDLQNEKQKLDTALIAVSGERNRANKQAAVAKAVNDFLREDVLALAALGNQRDPAEQPNPNLTVRDALARAAKRIGTRFADEPLVEAAIRSTIGDSYRQLGEYSAARPHLERALELYRKGLGPEAAETLMAINRLANWHDNQGQPDAIGLWLGVVEVGRRVHGLDHEATLTALNNLGVTYQKQGRLREAADYFQQALDGFRRSRGPLHPDTLTLTMNTANLLETNGDFAQAAALLKVVVATRVEQQGLENQDTLIARSNLALVQWRAGHFDEAERTLTDVLNSHRRLTGLNSDLTITSMNRLANFLLERGRFDEAEKLIRERLETVTRTQGRQHTAALAVLLDLGLLYYNQNRLTEAESVWREALEGFRRNLTPDHPTTLASLNNLGVLYRDLKRFDESESTFRELLTARRRLVGDEHLDVAQTLGELAETLIRQERFADAEPLLREALVIDAAKQPDNWGHSLDQMRLAASLLGQQKHAAAEPLLLAAYQGFTKSRELLPPWGKKYLLETVQHLVELYDAWDKPDEAAKWRKELRPAK